METNEKTGKPLDVLIALIACFALASSGFIAFLARNPVYSVYRGYALDVYGYHVDMNRYYNPSSDFPCEARLGFDKAISMAVGNSMYRGKYSIDGDRLSGTMESVEDYLTGSKSEDHVDFTGSLSQDGFLSVYMFGTSYYFLREGGEAPFIPVDPADIELHDSLWTDSIGVTADPDADGTEQTIAENRQDAVQEPSPEDAEPSPEVVQANPEAQPAPDQGEIQPVPDQGA